MHVHVSFSRPEQKAQFVLLQLEFLSSNLPDDYSFKSRISDREQLENCLTCI